MKAASTQLCRYSTRSRIAICRGMQAAQVLVACHCKRGPLSHTLTSIIIMPLNYLRNVGIKVVVEVTVALSRHPQDRDGQALMLQQIPFPKQRTRLQRQRAIAEWTDV